MLVDKNWPEKITASEYERAFTELANFLHELYLKQKMNEQQKITDDNLKEDTNV